MALQRMDNVLIVVEDLEGAKAFFTELGYGAGGRDAGRGVLGGLGIRRIMFAVDDIDDVVAHLRRHGGEQVEGIIIGLAEQLS